MKRFLMSAWAVWCAALITLGFALLVRVSGLAWDNPFWSSWAQAIGGVGAVCVAIWVVFRQRRDREGDAIGNFRYFLEVAVQRCGEASALAQRNAGSDEMRLHLKILDELIRFARTIEFASLGAQNGPVLTQMISHLLEVHHHLQDISERGKTDQRMGALLALAYRIRELSKKVLRAQSA